jgi:hypothetical protein
MRRRLLVLLTLLAACLPVACGADTASAPNQLAPAGSVFYGEVTIKPSGDQKADLDAVFRKLPGNKSFDQLVQEGLTKSFEESDSGLSYENDVKPWLGEKAAFFATGQNKDGDLEGAAGLIETTDEEAARDAIDKAAKGKGKDVTYRDVEYRRIDSRSAAGVVDGWLVAGNERGVKAAIDTTQDENARPIGEADAYDKALADVPDGSLGFLYMNTPELLDNVRSTLGSVATGSFAKLFSEPYVISGDADSEGFEFISTVPASISNLVLPIFGQGTDLIEGLPADSFAALAQPNLGKTIDYYVDLFAGAAGGRDVIEQQVRRASGLDLQRDVIGWMGDFGLFARGRTVPTINGALVIETSDPAASDRALAALERQFRKEGEVRVGRLAVPGGGEGYTLTSREVPQPIHIFRRDDRVIAAYGNAAARDAVRAATPLSDDQEYQSAVDSLGDGYQASAYIAMEPIIGLIESAGQVGDDPDWAEVKPYLESFGALVSGTREEGDRLVQKMRLTVP